MSLLAYAGPRPESEALPLRWSAIREHTILFRATKRGVPVERATRLPDALAHDLSRWRAASGDPPDSAPVIPNRRGEPWADYDWDNWRDRASAQPPQYVARQLGHSAATLLRDHARGWEDFDPAPRTDAEEQIRRVRSRLDVMTRLTPRSALDPVFQGVP